MRSDVALWAAMIAWWIAAIVPDRSLRAPSVVAIAICLAVELSQLYHTTTLDTARASTIGHLILGSGFDPRDFVAYAIGVPAAAACERIARSFLTALVAHPTICDPTPQDPSMGYIESQLLPNERIVARTARSKIVLVLPMLLVALFAGAGVGALISHQAAGLVFALLLLAVATGGIAWMVYRSADFAVTTSRLILKQGLISRRTLELQLNKVEAVNVDQSLFGRILGYGTLQVGGTGGTKEVFSIVNHPDAFRTAVQAQINAIYEPAGYQQSATDARQTPARAERQCPYCAETILAAAKICRFCNRDVSATAAG